MVIAVEAFEFPPGELSPGQQGQQGGEAQLLPGIPALGPPEAEGHAGEDGREAVDPERDTHRRIDPAGHAEAAERDDKGESQADLPRDPAEPNQPDEEEEQADGGGSHHEEEAGLVVDRGGDAEEETCRLEGEDEDGWPEAQRVTPGWVAGSLQGQLARGIARMRNGRRGRGGFRHAGQTCGGIAWGTGFRWGMIVKFAGLACGARWVVPTPGVGGPRVEGGRGRLAERLPEGSGRRPQRWGGVGSGEFAG